MSRHKSCSLYVDNFTFAQFGIKCPTCFALGEVHLCGSHPNRPPVVPGNYPIIALLTSHISVFLFSLDKLYLMILILFIPFY